MAAAIEIIRNLLKEADQRRAQLLVREAEDLLAFAGEDPTVLGFARRQVEAARALAPDDSRVALTLAKLDAQSGAYDAARASLAGILRAHSRNAEALHEMGMLLEETGDLPSARLHLQKAVTEVRRSHPRWGALAYLSLAELESTAGNHALARELARGGIAHLGKRRIDVRVLRDFLARSRTA